jgi:hypothetical protein
VVLSLAGNVRGSTSSTCPASLSISKGSFVLSQIEWVKIQNPFIPLTKVGVRGVVIEMDGESHDCNRGIV